MAKEISSELLNNSQDTKTWVPAPKMDLKVETIKSISNSFYNKCINNHLIISLELVGTPGTPTLALGLAMVLTVLPINTMEQMSF